jgi:hypothetical protein
LPPAERQRVAHALLSDEGSWMPGERAVTQTSSENAAFSERWSGKFTLPDPDSKDAKLTYLLDRFSD